MTVYVSLISPVIMHVPLVCLTENRIFLWKPSKLKLLQSSQVTCTKGLNNCPTIVQITWCKFTQKFCVIVSECALAFACKIAFAAKFAFRKRECSPKIGWAWLCVQS